MGRLKLSITSLAVFLLSIFLRACAPSIEAIPKTNATLGYVSSVHNDLISLPPPKEKIFAAVYKFRDQTGQYKTSASGVSWSTAVTQGATSMLLKALEDSHWFTTLEREGLSNLLNERKIIRSTRENYRAQGQKNLAALPPLLFAGITLEGGIISYETNTITGGMGAKYFGIGSSTKYQKDEVTVYLRAVSTQNGRVLKTVYTTKSILSMAVDASVYRYVRFKRLLEVETGFTYNEPPQMCVMEAIEKAVFSLIVEGVLDNIWAFENPQDVENPVVVKYMKEKDEIEHAENFFRRPGFMDKKVGIGINIGGQYYLGDLKNPEVEAAPEFFIKYGLTSRLYFSMNAIWGNVANRDNFTSFINLYELKMLYALAHYRKISPYFFIGGGLMNYNLKDKNGKTISIEKIRNYVSSASAGIGFEINLNSNFSINTSIDVHYPFTDQLDGIMGGDLKDYFYAGKAGFVYYLGF